MHFLVNDDRKFLMGWSAKCGCTTMKKWYAEVSGIEIEEGMLHTVLGYGNTPYSMLKEEEMEKYAGYKKFCLIRDPYKRLVSGYVSKYVVKQVFENKGWNNFSEFVSVLRWDRKFRKIDKHHFIPQTQDYFAEFKKQGWQWDHVMNLDTINDDIEVINKMLGITIPIAFSNRTVYHEAKTYDKPAFLMSDEEIKQYAPGYEHYYSPKLARKVAKIYAQDLKYFRALGFDFTPPLLHVA